MFSVEFGNIYRIFLISSISELFGNSSRINFFRVQHKLQAIQRLDEDEFLRIVAADYGVESAQRFVSNARGAVTNRKAMNLAEYDKIDSAVFFILDVVIDVRLSRSRDYMFLR